MPGQCWGHARKAPVPLNWHQLGTRWELWGEEDTALRRRCCFPAKGVGVSWSPVGVQWPQHILDACGLRAPSGSVCISNKQGPAGPGRAHRRSLESVLVPPGTGSWPCFFEFLPVVGAMLPGALWEQSCPDLGGWGALSGLCLLRDLRGHWAAQAGGAPASRGQGCHHSACQWTWLREQLDEFQELEAQEGLTAEPVSHSHGTWSYRGPTRWHGAGRAGSTGRCTVPSPRPSGRLALFLLSALDTLWAGPPGN